MNILLCGKLEWNDQDLDLISGSGNHNIYFCPDEEGPVPVSESSVDIIVCNWFFKYHKISDFVNLKFIQLLSSGYNGVDPDEVKSKGIMLCNARNVYSIPISEFVVGSILSFYKDLGFFIKNKTGHVWEKNRQLHELYDKHVLIVGMGSIGIEIAKRMSGFTSHIYGCNRTVKENSFFAGVFSLNDLEKIVPDMDIVILCVALADETFHLVDHNILCRMKKNSLIVNISRGSVIDEADLIVSLKEKKIGGAILDVFENEPLPVNNPLWDMENVMITPHNAFVSENNTKRLKDLICENIRTWIK